MAPVWCRYCHLNLRFIPPSQCHDLLRRELGQVSNSSLCELGPEKLVCIDDRTRHPHSLVQNRVPHSIRADFARATAQVADRSTQLGPICEPNPEPRTDPVPDWLLERLVHTAGVDPSDVEQMTGEAAMQRWEQYMTTRE